MPTQYCRHIKVDGLRCKSFAVRGASLCYFHRSMNAHRRLPPLPEPAILHPINGDGGLQREPMLAETATAPLLLDFPVLEDRESIQMALSMLLSALGQNRLEPKRAGMMLYNLQVASSNVRDVFFSDLDDSVREVVRGPEGIDLAPDEDPEELDTERLEGLGLTSRESAPDEANDLGGPKSNLPVRQASCVRDQQSC